MNEKNIVDIILTISGWLSICIVLTIAFFLFYNWLPLFKTVKPQNFIFGTKWYPTLTPPHYGILPMFVATIEISALSLSFVFPISLMLAIFISYIALKSITYGLKIFLEFFSSIPSVILGLIGLTVLSSCLQNSLNINTGLNILNASIMLTILTTPITASMLEDFITSFPIDQIEGASTLGATKMETLFKIIVPGLKGPFTAIALLSIGRIIGETMIVLMVSGNAAIFPKSIFDPAKPLSATIAAEMGETAYGSPHFFALFGIGSIIFCITLIINMVGEKIRSKYEREMRRN